MIQAIMAETKPVVVEKKPIKTELKKGAESYWCACGRSASQPFCDGSHKGTGITPLKFVAEDAEALGCEKELSGIRTILSRGTSAHQQLRDFEREREAGATVEESLRAVVDTLIANTAKGL